MVDEEGKTGEITKILQVVPEDYLDELQNRMVASGLPKIHTSTIYVYLNSAENSITSPRIISILRMVKEIESFFEDCPLDIEFARDTRGKLFTLQIRKITCSSRWHPNVQNSVDKILPILKHYLERISI